MMCKLVKVSWHLLDTGFLVDFHQFAHHHITEDRTYQELCWLYPMLWTNLLCKFEASLRFLVCLWSFQANAGMHHEISHCFLFPVLNSWFTCFVPWSWSSIVKYESTEDKRHCTSPYLIIRMIHICNYSIRFEISIINSFLQFLLCYSLYFT
jgi:hypothetical protein